MKFTIMHLSTPSCNFLSLKAEYSLDHTFLTALSMQILPVKLIIKHCIHLNVYYTYTAPIFFIVYSSVIFSVSCAK